ncbi:hypothetical protein BCR43DRAFT_481688 [Syncephalastrum racemosum]|uniref:Uncharacterized protein n=1 Tax=Syncephalastrum racemosum TaxID=13706 RepID=A0A1X2HSH1_SYNRA|nr:hypothetical protein BCR43DRAFT_481688 [Syncephalastrum racemosum]
MNSKCYERHNATMATVQGNRHCTKLPLHLGRQPGIKAHRHIPQARGKTSLTHEIPCLK